MTLVGNGLVPFRLFVYAEGVTLSASLPGQGTFPTKDVWWISLRQSVVAWRMTLVGNGLVPFRLVVFAQGVALSASLPGQGTFPAKDACLQIKSSKKTGHSLVGRNAPILRTPPIMLSS